MAVENGNVPEPSEDRGFFVEHVEEGEDEEATYEEAWQVVNERTLRGWKLRGMEADLDSGVKLVWEASDDRCRQG